MNVLDQTGESYNTKFGPQRKDRKSSYRARQISALFCHLFALTLGENCVKCIRVTEIVKEIKFKRAWSKLEAKKYFHRQIQIKYLRITVVFM